MQFAYCCLELYTYKNNATTNNNKQRTTNDFMLKLSLLYTFLNIYNLFIFHYPSQLYIEQPQYIQTTTTYHSTRYTSCSWSLMWKDLLCVRTCFL